VGNESEISFGRSVFKKYGKWCFFLVQTSLEDEGNVLKSAVEYHTHTHAEMFWSYNEVKICNILVYSNKSEGVKEMLGGKISNKVNDVSGIWTVSHIAHCKVWCITEES
jgi:hypothetical protein